MITKDDKHRQSVRGLRLQGTGVAPGIGLGRIVLIQDYLPEIAETKATAGELTRFSGAVERLNNVLRKRAEQAQGIQAGILESYLTILSDPHLLTKIEKIVAERGVNCEYAANEVFEKYAGDYAMSGDDLLIARSSDIRDIKNNLLKMLRSGSITDLRTLPAGAVLAARALAPSIAAGLDPEIIHGQITLEGDHRSYPAMIARSLGIPAVTDIPIHILEDEMSVIVDGWAGLVFVDPPDDLLEEYRRTGGVSLHVI